MTERSNQPKTCLSDENINLINGLVFFALLIFGPIEPYGLAVRILYLIGIPILVWLVLKYIGGYWRADKLENDRLTRFIAAVLAVALFIGAINAFREKSHASCTQYTKSNYGQECVGDYVPASGPDLAQGFLLAGAGIMATWYSVFRRDD